MQIKLCVLLSCVHQTLLQAVCINFDRGPPTYIGRTERQLGICLIEHIPRWVERWSKGCNLENDRPLMNEKQVTSMITMLIT